MVVGFDLDGTLDRPALALLCKTLLATGHEVHVISGSFPGEENSWQDATAKHAKLSRLGILFQENLSAGRAPQGQATLHVLLARPQYDQATKLHDLGLRKGDLCHRLGIELFFDDSEQYCTLIPKMSGNTVTLRVAQ